MLLILSFQYPKLIHLLLPFMGGVLTNILQDVFFFLQIFEFVVWFRNIVPILLWRQCCYNGTSLVGTGPLGLLELHCAPVCLMVNYPDVFTATFVVVHINSITCNTSLLWCSVVILAHLFLIQSISRSAIRVCRYAREAIATTSFFES